MNEPELIYEIMIQISAKRPTLINIGRSNVASETDLLTALDSEWIDAAVLDVFDEEPLPGRDQLQLAK